ncbi:hypothetical protein [Nocardia sp. 2TAF39]|uniref:hypothetical protein n=2 Tax=unclassified Nocardia TaxID=2637762 RepID=UPI003F987E0F
MSAIDGLAWTGVQDSSGIRLSDYMFATGHGSLLAPQDTALSLVLSLEFTVFMVIVMSASWPIGLVASFRRLDWLGKPSNEVADAPTDRVATPIILVVAASSGAFFVAVFVVRGYRVGAVPQVVVDDDTRGYIGSNLESDLRQAALRYSKDMSDRNIADAMRIKNRAVNIGMILSKTHAGQWTN